MVEEKQNILTLVLSEKKILNETKNNNPPPFKLNGRSLSSFSATENEQFLLFGFSTKIMIEKYSFECVKFYTSWLFCVKLQLDILLTLLL